jgi:hypothetical protein
MDPNKIPYLSNCPLVRWRQGGPNYIPPTQHNDKNAVSIYPNMKPSAGDVEMIKAIYPFYFVP